MLALCILLCTFLAHTAKFTSVTVINVNKIKPLCKLGRKNSCENMMGKKNWVKMMATTRSTRSINKHYENTVICKLA